MYANPSANLARGLNPELLMVRELDVDCAAPELRGVVRVVVDHSGGRADVSHL